MKTESSYKLLNQRVKLDKVKLTDFQKQSHHDMNENLMKHLQQQVAKLRVIC